MQKIIKPSLAKGMVDAPPSKSYAHRSIIAAALADKESIIDNIELSDDITATIKAVNTLGAVVEKYNQKLIIKPRQLEINDELVFDCQESGSTLRFMIPIALMIGKCVIFKGTKRLLSRGISVYETIFKQDNIIYEQTDETIMLFGKLKGGLYQVLGNVSSQFITGLLFSLPLLPVDSIIEIIPPIESTAYIDMTIVILSMFNIKIKKEQNRLIIKGNQHYISHNIRIEGDYSNAAFLDAFNYIGGNVVINDLNPNSIQGDKRYQQYFPLLKQGAPYLNLADCIDLGPILFTMATILNGAHFIGTKRLAIKESNRVLDMLEELAKFGCLYEVYDNEVIIKKSTLKMPQVELNAHNDHRILMSLVVISSIYGGVINGCEAVHKSFPTFFKKIKQLGIEVKDGINERY